MDEGVAEQIVEPAGVSAALESGGAQAVLSLLRSSLAAHCKPAISLLLLLMGSSGAGKTTLWHSLDKQTPVTS